MWLWHQATTVGPGFEQCTVEGVLQYECCFEMQNKSHGSISVCLCCQQAIKQMKCLLATAYSCQNLNELGAVFCVRQDKTSHNMFVESVLKTVEE